MQAKILVVENEAITSLDIQTLLEQMGFEVVSTASSGVESIQKARDFKPDLILMDILLSDEMDGIEAAKKIKTIFDVPIIYITAYNDEQTFKRAKLTEPYGFITKPFDYNGLKVSIETALYKHELDKKLKDSETRFRSVFENSFDAILLTKPDGTVLAANYAAEDLFDMSEEEIIKAGRDGLVVKDNRLKSALKARSRTGKVRAELLHKRKDGSTFLGEVTSSIFTDVDGSIKTSMIIRDLTERKNAEEELRQARSNLEEKVQNRTTELENAYDSLKESEGKFRALYDDNPSMYFTIDPEFRILSVNSFGAEELGYNVPELIGKSLISKIFYEKDRKLEAQNLKNTLENKGQVFHWELRKVRKDGSILWVKETARAVKESEGNIVIYTVCEDITDRKESEKALKESEEKFRELFDKALDAIALTEIQENKLPGHFIEVNEAVIQKSGYTKEELLNMTPLDLFTVDSRDEILKSASELRRKGYTTFEAAYILKDGSQVPAEVTVHVFKLGGKDVALAIARDITERKKAEEALRESLASKSKILNALKESEEKLRIYIIELEQSTDEIRNSQIELDVLHRKYHDLFNTAPVGYITLNPRGIITEVNDTMVELTGFQKSRFNMNVFAFL